MNHQILSEIIQQTFTADIGKHKNDGMFVRFRGRDEDCLDLLIWAKMNYVGVWIRSIAQREAQAEIGGGWHSLSYHDSCWRSDGVDRFCNALSKENNARYFSLHTFGIPSQSWYRKVYISEEFGKELMDEVRARRAGETVKPPALVDMGFVY